MLVVLGRSGLDRSDLSRLSRGTVAAAVLLKTQHRREYAPPPYNPAVDDLSSWYKKGCFA
jgi:hypothetical protein